MITVEIESIIKKWINPYRLSLALSLYVWLPGEHGDLSWTDNWVLLLDAMIQIHLVVKPDIKSALPTGIRRLAINPIMHNDSILWDSATEQESKDRLFGRVKPCHQEV